LTKHILITAEDATRIDIRPLENGVRYLVLDRPKAMIILNALSLVSEGTEFEIDVYRGMADEMNDFIERSWA